MARLSRSGSTFDAKILASLAQIIEYVIIRCWPSLISQVELPRLVKRTVPKK